MRKVRFLALALVTTAATLAASPRAHAQYVEEYTADTWPFEITKRPLTLAPGMLEVRGDTLRISLSGGAVGEPISLAPHVYVGINDKLTVGVTHQIGVCLTPGEDNGCLTAYHDVGAEALYGFMQGGNAQLALRGGITLPRFSPFALGLQGGAIARVRGGKIAVVAEPSIYLGLAGRSNGDDTSAIPEQEIIDAPVAFQVQLQPQTAVFLTSGIRASLRDIGDTFEGPVGIGAVYALNQRLDLGGEFQLENLFGQNGGLERRILFLRAALRV